MSKAHKKIDNLKKMSISKRLFASYATVLVSTGIAALLGVITILYAMFSYQRAMNQYGFSQGDVGMAMATFADARSSLRAAIGYDSPEDVANVTTEYQAQKEACIQHVADMEEHILTKESRDAYEEIMANFDNYWNLADELVALSEGADRSSQDQAQERTIKELDPLYNVIYDDMSAVMDFNVEKGYAAERSLRRFSIADAAAMIVIMFVALRLSAKLGRYIAASICKPLRELEQRFRTFAQGDLESPFPECDTQDELSAMNQEASGMAQNINAIINDLGNVCQHMANGDMTVTSGCAEKYVGKFQELYQATSEMKRQMSSLIGQVKEASEQLTAGSENLASAAQDLAEGSTEQAGAVEELQATITEVTTAADKTAADLKESYEQAKKYSADADVSRGEMRAMVEAMNRISETSQKIGNIISELEDIASQTNLLSLNASIEAARAGEVGKGFAVVADEIRKLAEQSAASAVSTRDLIESALSEVEEGNKAVATVSETLDEVVEGMELIAEKSKILSEQSESQAESMNQVEMGVNQISEVVQSNSATAQETSATSQELYAQAENMKGLVEHFQI